MFKKVILVSSLFFIVIFPFELLAYDSESLDKLPKNSKTFIEDNFNNTNIKSINKINNRFYVLLEDDFSLIFDNSGIWCEVDGKDKPIPTGFIPENVIYTVDRTNPNTNILKIVKKWNTYIITLDTHINIFIDSSGMLVGQKIPD
ncbi:PepSY-like domain-containing protein [uncultured Brachyspira sp.]|uniref:PepSY-like domain-containing protein n=1 Tax=uncultured Brachyspira sp. TaxID=221953 RepID=UPI0026209F2E|nr:PepSY-like domain-containing protein [uncultured Brachyspira sp.]